MGAAHPPTQPLPPRFARHPVLHSAQRAIGRDWGRGCVRACGKRGAVRADTVSAPLLLSDSHLRGARMVRVASVLFPACASPGRGCAHDPTCRPACLTPTPHLSHATLRTLPRMRDDVRVARERWGIGVGHAERTRGHAHTQCGVRPASLQRPLVGMPLGSVPPHCMCMGQSEREGGHSRTPACKWREGVPAALAACPLPSLRSLLLAVLARMGAPPCTPFAWAGSEQKGGGTISQVVVHPPSCATLAWVSGMQGGGGGLCRAPTFPYLVGAQTSPRLCINGGNKGGAAGGPALSVLFDLSGGKGGKGGGIPLCTALHSPFAHRGGVAQPTCIGWGATGGCTGGDHTARGGGGTQPVFTLPLPSLNPRSHAALCAGGGG